MISIMLNLIVSLIYNIALMNDQEKNLFFLQCLGIIQIFTNFAVVCC